MKKNVEDESRANLTSSEKQLFLNDIVLPATKKLITTRRATRLNEHETNSPLVTQVYIRLLKDPT